MKRGKTQVLIDDTTLREGEQTPGVVFNVQDKVRIAQRLDMVGVQRIEAGFPAASEGEMKAVKAIIAEELNIEIFGFARAVKSDIDAVVDCGCYGVMMSFPPSDIHLKYKLRLTREEYLKRAVECVRYAKEKGLYITYSAEDSTRTDLDFLLTVFKKVIENGADCPRIVDTLGLATPHTIKNYVLAVKDITDLPIEVHCHNDHGLAVANSLAAMEAGASIISSAVNGLGERAGIAATEEVIINLHNFYDVKNFHMKNLHSLCKIVEELSRIQIAPNKPVSGENIFSHTSGIHQDAVLKHPVTYEPYPPELIGRTRKLILGKLSGSHAIKAKLEEFGINPDEAELKKITEMVKKVSESRRSALTDNEFLDLLQKIIPKSLDKQGLLVKSKI
jgi:isopropylmalate/homocitrate/citramalate synthase